MTDLEITKLCAEAMGYTGFRTHCEGRAFTVREVAEAYCPLHDDAQAMALVKKLHLTISGLGRWVVEFHQPWEADHPNDLNRAICECVAKMQKAKS